MKTYLESNGPVPSSQSLHYGDRLEPIAVVGMSAKFPQDAHNVEGFWDMLVNARSAMTEAPKDRYNVEAFYHEDTARVSGLNVRGGHFLKGDFAAFDAPFFKIHGEEAACMDPQQRCLLERSWCAFENAGIPVSKVAGSKTSVYIGNFSRDYEATLSRDPDMQAKYRATGTSPSILANRLSWFYDLCGPSIAIDTACSSSLLAVHMACQSLRCGESEMGSLQGSIVGGCNLIYAPDMTVSLAKLNLLSPDSRCYSFDHRANGYSRGEGFGIVILQPLSAAIRDGHTIRAVIRATGTNQDGRTTGIMQPSSDAQERLIRETYQSAGLDFKTTRFVEAHGTGTPKGDPIEAEAIGRVFGAYRTSADPLYLGAVKSNIGHLEGGSGVASLIKSILVLENAIIPPNINFEKPNPKVKLDKWNLAIPTSTMPWPSQNLRRVSVNSFGFGGSNAHVVLDDALHYLQLRGLSGIHCTKTLKEVVDHEQTVPSLKRQQVNGLHKCQVDSPRLIVLSAGDGDGVGRQKETYMHHIKNLTPSCKASPAYFENLAYTLCQRRNAFCWRDFVVASDCSEMARELGKLPNKSSRAISKCRLAFVFTGQGAQWVGMGKELMAYSIFRNSVQAADEYLLQLGCPWSTESTILAEVDAPDVDQPDVSQTICTVLQVALVELLDSWNIQPTACMGGSSGEIAAAYCSGMISRRDAWKIAYSRGVVSLKAQQMNGDAGGMIAVGLEVEKVHDVIDLLRGKNKGKIDIVVACINSSRNITLSGTRQHLDELGQLLMEKKVFYRTLRTGGNAYHSHYMDAVAAMYQDLMGIFDPVTSIDRCLVPLYSTVTGHLANRDLVGHAGYWVQNLLLPVQFQQALTSLIQAQTAEDLQLSHITEVGPSAGLRRSIEDVVQGTGTDIKYLHILQASQHSHRSMLNTAGLLFNAGYDLNLEAVNSSQGSLPDRQLLVDLPEYSFNHSRRYWHESRSSKDFRFRGYKTHELLGTRTGDSSVSMTRWRLVIRRQENPWIADYNINNVVVYPAAGMLVIAIEALRQLLDAKVNMVAIRLKNVRFLRPMIIPEEIEGLETMTSLRKCAKDDSKAFLDWYEFDIMSHDHGDWQNNCKGLVAVEYQAEEFNDGPALEINQRFSLQETEDKCRSSTSSQEMYNRLEHLGYAFGPAFRVLESIHYDNANNAVGAISLNSYKNFVRHSVHPHLIHPTILDGLFQIPFSALSNGGTKDIPTLVPNQIEEMRLSTALLEDSLENVYVLANSQSIGSRGTVSQITAYDDWYTTQIWIRGLQSTIIANDKAKHEPQMNDLAFRLEWRPDYTLLSDDQIRDRCSKSAPKSTTEVSTAIEEVETACFIYLRRALSYVAQHSIPISKPHLLRYYKWAQVQLNYLEVDNIVHLSIRLAGILGDEDREDQLLEKMKKGNVEARLCSRVGENLVDILLGRVDALSLLFQDSLLDEYYLWAIHGEGRFQQVSAYIEMIAHKNPSIRILEIGAGTGSGTAAMLDVLSPPFRGEKGIAKYSQYTFTDISPSFFEKARVKFSSELNRMNFKTFDAGQDPEDCSFEVGTYDLVLAVSAIHATPDILKTLKNIRKLLKPGGKLMLFEQCNTKILRVGFFAGLLSGWWLGKEPERELGAVLSEPHWNRYLRQSNFSGIDLNLADAEQPCDQCFTMLVATATEEQQPNRLDLSIEKKVALVASSSEKQQNLAQQLSSRVLEMSGMSCEIMTPESIVSYEYVIYLSELEEPVIASLSSAKLAGLKQMIRDAKIMIWIGSSTLSGKRDPAFGAVHGWARSVRSEYGRLKLVTLGLEEENCAIKLVEKIWPIIKLNLVADVIEEEYEERDSILWIPRLVPAHDINKHIHSRIGETDLRPLPIKSTTQIELAVMTTGVREILYFRPSRPMDGVLQDDEVEIESFASSLDNNDVDVLLGHTAGHYIGKECAGVIRRLPESYTGDLVLGDRVCCLVKGGHKTLLRTKICLVATIPTSLSWAEAASFPLTFCSAYYGLIEAANLQPSDKILICLAANDIGQATIQLAKYIGINPDDILVTVDSKEEKESLLKTYGLQSRNVFLNQFSSIAQQIKDLTNAHGVDVIINTPKCTTSQIPLGCVSSFGRIITISVKDANPDSPLMIPPNTKNVSYFSVNIIDMLQSSLERLGKTFTKVSQLLKTGCIHSIKASVYSYAQIQDGLQVLQSRKVFSKLVFEIMGDDHVMAIPPQQEPIRFDPQSTYVISGFGGLGRSIAVWMADCGCKNLLLLSRSGGMSVAANTVITNLRDRGVTVRAPVCDVSNFDSLAKILQNLDLPPIKGCVQAAMVLQSGIFENLSLDEFNTALVPKMKGSWNLHKLLPQNLDFFVLLSSLSGVLGIEGQTNYAAGNAYQDALARYRVSRGKKAVAIDLGIVKSVGHNAEEITPLLLNGYAGVSEDQLHAILDYCCGSTLAVPPEPQIMFGIDNPAELKARGKAEPLWLKQAMCSVLRQMDSMSENAVLTPENDHAELFKNASGAEERLHIILEALKEKLSRVLSAAKEDLDDHQTMSSYGTDSLVAVELRNWIQAEFGVEVAVFDILSNNSIMDFAQMVCKRYTA